MVFLWTSRGKPEASSWPGTSSTSGSSRGTRQSWLCSPERPRKWLLNSQELASMSLPPLLQNEPSEIHFSMAGELGSMVELIVDCIGRRVWSRQVHLSGATWPSTSMTEICQDHWDFLIALNTVENRGNQVFLRFHVFGLHNKATVIDKSRNSWEIRAIYDRVEVSLSEAAFRKCAVIGRQRGLTTGRGIGI